MTICYHSDACSQPTIEYDPSQATVANAKSRVSGKPGLDFFDSYKEYAGSVVGGPGSSTTVSLCNLLSI
jgi:hypothetical protein